jgi:hypothetical protein
VLRDEPALRFEQLIDLCGVDYSAYGDGAGTGPRFAVVYHLLSLAHNWRLRLRVFARTTIFRLDSVIGVWPSANWYEREAFDLFGIVFTGHPDLRASSPITVSSGIRSARISRCPATSRCATTRSSSGSSTSRSPSSRATRRDRARGDYVREEQGLRGRGKKDLIRGWS